MYYNNVNEEVNMLSRKPKNNNDLKELELIIDNTAEEINDLVKDKLNHSDEEFNELHFPIITLDSIHDNNHIHHSKYNHILKFTEILLDISNHLKANDMNLEDINDADYDSIYAICEYLEDELIDPDIFLQENMGNMTSTSFLDILFYKLAHCVVLLHFVIPDTSGHLESITKKVEDFIDYYDHYDSL